MSPSVEPTSEQAEMSMQLVPAGLLEGGEIVILALKPSSWFVLVSSLPVLLSAAAVAAVAYLMSFSDYFGDPEVVWYFCAGAALLRLMIASWQWLGRTYVLTNRRIVCIRGLVRVELAAAGLAQVREALLAASLGERIVGAGSIYCLIESDSPPAVAWQTVARPAEVHEIILETIGRAKRQS